MTGGGEGGVGSGEEEEEGGGRLFEANAVKVGQCVWKNFFY